MSDSTDQPPTAAVSVPLEADLAAGFSESTAVAIGRRQWLTLTAALLGWMFDGLEMGIFPIVGRPALRSMIAGGAEADVSRWFGYAVAVFLVGAALGGIIFGWLGDRIGRVRALSASVLVYSLFTGACFFATEPWHLAVLRFLAALGMGGEWSLGVALVMESWPGIARPVLAGLIGAASNVGFLLIGLLGLGFPVGEGNWRWVMLAGAAPALLTFFIRMFVPESEQWKRVVQTATSSPLAEIFGAELRKTSLLAIAFASIALVGTWGSVQWVPTWIDHMTSGNRPEAKAIVSILLSVGAIIGSFLGAVLGGQIGRRPVYFCLCLLSLALCSYLFRGLDAYDGQLLMVATLVGCVTAAFYGWLPLYLPELFPTRARATGQGLSFNFGRILAAAGALGTGSLVRFFDNDYARAGATISLVYALGLVLIWLAPETRGKPLPD
jgi:MFS family permease